MKNSRKSLSCMALAFGVAFAMTADSADAGRCSGSRSSSISRRSSNSRSTRSSGFRSSTSRSRIGSSRIGNSRNNSSRFGKSRFGSNKSGSISKQSNRRGSSKIGSKFGSKIGSKFGSKSFGKSFSKNSHHKFGYHKNGHHHHHHHWGGWYGHGHHHHGWGLHSYRHARFFVYSFRTPTVAYCNPYCQAPGFLPEDGPQFDYSQRIQQGNAQGNGQTEAGMKLLMAASEAFAKGDLQTAMTIADRAAREMPKFLEIHQFRSLVLFAMGKYGESASAAHAALTDGPGWNWTVLKGFYPNKDVYTQQLRRLESYTTANSTDAGGRFLLAYHYLMMGHGPAAITELRAVVELEPRDQLAARILNAVSANKGQQPAQPTQPKIENQRPAGPEVNGPYNSGPNNSGPNNNGPVNSGPIETPQNAAPQIETQPKQPVAPFNPVGQWQAKRDDGLVVNLTLSQDGTFIWNATVNNKPIKFDGKFTLVNTDLKLTRSSDGQALEGVITIKGSDEFQLRMKGRDASDPGLKFVRQ